MGGWSRLLLTLLVLDLRLPIRSGIRILDSLRVAHWHVPAILITASGDEAMRERARRLGAVLFCKPFDLDDLRTAASSLMRRAP